jgi:hypothetical protein
MNALTVGLGNGSAASNRAASFAKWLAHGRTRASLCERSLDARTYSKNSLPAAISGGYHSLDRSACASRLTRLRYARGECARSSAAEGGSIGGVGLQQRHVR